MPVAWVAAIPSQRSGELVPGFGRALAERLGIPFADVLERVGDGPPQREMANSAQQVANVRGAFAVTAAPPPGAGLLVDDIRFSGWTLAMVAGQLRRQGRRCGLPARPEYRLLNQGNPGEMEDLVDTLTRGNPLEVKTVLASVAFALAAYQVAGRVAVRRLSRACSSCSPSPGSARRETSCHEPAGPRLAARGGGNSGKGKSEQRDDR